MKNVNEANQFHSEINSFVRLVLNLPATTPLRIVALERVGSSRSFSRVWWEKGNSAIFMHYEHTRRENTYYVDIAKFLQSIHIPSPRILAHDANRGFVLMEDLGDIDLWSIRQQPWEERGHYYRLTLSLIYRLHTYPLERFPWNAVHLMERFDAELYGWEHTYFTEHFVSSLCGIHLTQKEHENLFAELRELTRRLMNTPNCLIHRDLQSRNVMIYQNKPFLIDFQGMRVGSPFYDLASLLYDPYVNLSEEEQNELLLYYFLLLNENSSSLREESIPPTDTHTGDHILLLNFHNDWDSFVRTFWLASAQRLMQALGAYGFLGRIKNLPWYFTWIPNALSRLIDVTGKTTLLPQLHTLAIRCQRCFSQKNISNT